ncbi:peptidoglycan DD-metalloendopeptidase family protein [Paenibacillus campinasensis]|uniref:Peptidoglycan DD-metalloendopeptidase family protein n=1 Tax=Paenibacillus campinasensis TaxID=66347 RepID=A0ABW9T8G4_9BACL|nr:peptidoglycan DD-metalloendopeptidase family protein [Paenibacillus campinasensis]MUG68420.1 peptidoglycan DD-metalloendopeptidase family protein [Paenibacillus campinasensis]
MRGFKGSWWKDSALLKKEAQSSAESQASGSASKSPSHPERRGWWAKQSKWVWITAGAIIIAGSIYTTSKAYVNANTIPYYHVYVDGKHVGAIEDDAQLDQLFEAKQKEYQDKYPGTFMVLQTEGITTRADRGYKPEIDSEQTLQKLDGMLQAYARGVELKVNGETVAVVKDQETAQAALEAAKLKYAPDAAQVETSQVKFTKVSASASTDNKASEGSELKSVNIKESIELARTKASPEEVLDVEAAVQVLTDTKDQPVIYTVKEGDTISSIAQQYGMTSAEVMALNPEVEEKYVQIGSELRLTKPEAPITVRTVETVTEKQPSKPEIIVRESDELPKGTRKVVRPGRDGVKVVNYSVTKENGQVVAKQWLGQEVVQEALPEVVYKGTKVEKPAAPAVQASSSKQFAWPVSGARVTSSFGSRWGRSHDGIDIVGNRTIKASAAGKVVFAGEQSGYGKVVIVDHGNGYRTLYGHLNSISVRNGQSLQQGSKVGVMGSTGRSTGIHLHFEIQKNGVPQNPMKYL